MRTASRFCLLTAAAWGLVALALLASGCGGGSSAADAGLVEGACEAVDGGATEYLTKIGCSADFEALASLPLDATLPGARSTKVVFDQADSALYFQNSIQYPIHYAFASTHLSGNGKPVVEPLSQFNTTEYFSPDRRFVLGAVTHYEQPKVWALEISPYDTASATMIDALCNQVKAHAFFGPALVFHPTSDAVAVEAKKVTACKVVTTDDLYNAIDFQPLTLGVAVGHIKFVLAANVDDTTLSYQDIVVLDEAPNDISVVQGLITQEFQTPLSHINVLSANRKTPNMGLRKAMTNPILKANEGKLVKLTVTASAWTVESISEADAEAFWKEHKPTPVVLPQLNNDVKELTDIEKVTPEPAKGESLRDKIKTAVLAFGGKAAHYSVLSRTDGVPMHKAFAVPVYYYTQWMERNGYFKMLDGFLADATFNSDPSVRATKLAAMTAAMLKASTFDADFEAALKAKLAADYPNQTMRFRTSTNSEDLDGFPCAGCYDSHSGDPAKWSTVLDAIRQTYASAWKYRTFEERNYYGVDHKSVGMALLVAHNFPDENEKANGVAVTANPFDASGLDPALYVNVQYGGDAEVVAPPPGVQSDQFLLYFDSPNTPITYLAHSNILPSGMTTVLTNTQIHALGTALKAIHERFSPAYGPAAGNNGWYAMDVEFKFGDEDNPGQAATLYVKQARPYPGRGN